MTVLFWTSGDRDKYVYLRKIQQNLLIAMIFLFGMVLHYLTDTPLTDLVDNMWWMLPYPRPGYTQ